MGLFANPSCVVLIKNMVGPGEVDASLVPDTTAECLKYGPVNRVVVHEVSISDRQRLQCPDEECVRTFVAFERQDSAIRAFRDMNGRFFAGRKLTASFFDEVAFGRNELAPKPNEW